MTVNAGANLALARPDTRKPVPAWRAHMRALVTALPLPSSCISKVTIDTVRAGAPLGLLSVRARRREGARAVSRLRTVPLLVQHPTLRRYRT